MPWPTAPKITLSNSDEDVLEALASAHKTPQQIAVRARIILLAGASIGNREIARRLKKRNRTVRRWRNRWHDSHACQSVAQRLADEARSGRKATYTPEQICAIVAMACEQPDKDEDGPPITHWSARELADEAARRGISKQISPRSVGRYLKRIRPQAAPHPLLAEQKAR